uniref:Uncharacterized protein n=1 Tax=Clytia hemisphaerica TaxID=252671 RepID=A0A7M5X9A9_9CNID
MSKLNATLAKSHIRKNGTQARPSIDIHLNGKGHVETELVKHRTINRTTSSPAHSPTLTRAIKCRSFLDDELDLDDFCSAKSGLGTPNVTHKTQNKLSPKMRKRSHSTKSEKELLKHFSRINLNN